MRLENLIKKIKKDVKEEFVKEVVAKKTVEIEGLAKLYCPVDLGYLRASITSNVEVKNNNITGFIGTAVFYAPFVEYGTGIYALDGNGRQTPWTYFDESFDVFIKTVGQHPQLFFQRAYEVAKGSELK